MTFNTTLWPPFGVNLSCPTPIMAYNKLLRTTVGADLSCPPPIYRARRMSLYPHKLPCKANTCIVGLTLAVNLGGVAGDTKWRTTSMTVFEIIKNRRSIGKMTEHRPTRKQIAQILEAATHAPNHHKVEPWKFFVLAGQSRAELGNVMARSLAERLGDSTNITLSATDVTLSAAKGLALLNKERNKLLRSPVVIIAAAEHPQQPNVLAIENIEAVAAAVQNMLLVAE